MIGKSHLVVTYRTDSAKYTKTRSGRRYWWILLIRAVARKNTSSSDAFRIKLMKKHNYLFINWDVKKLPPWFRWLPLFDQIESPPPSNGPPCQLKTTIWWEQARELKVEHATTTRNIWGRIWQIEDGSKMCWLFWVPSSAAYCLPPSSGLSVQVVASSCLLWPGFDQPPCL